MKDLNRRHKIISKLIDINIIGVRSIVNHLPYILIKKPKEKQVITTLYDFKMEIDPVKDKNGIENTLYYTGTYEKGTLHVIKQILKFGDVFVDVGANIGLMSIFASMVVGRLGKVHAFEPNPATYEILKKNINLNNITNIKAIPFGVGSHKSTLKIYDRWDVGRGGATMIKPDIETDCYDVDVVSISDYFKAIEKKVDIIKFDIEGFELEALKGAIKLIKIHYPILIIEILFTNKDAKIANGNDIYNFITKIEKYKLFKLGGSKKRVSKLIEIKSLSELPAHDNIFCFTSKHLDNMPKNLFY